jgi:hypothetical protein
MTPYFCVVYRISDTYRRNFETEAEAIEFRALMGGTAYRCERFGNLLQVL